METGKQDRTNEAPLFYALLLGVTTDYVNTINKIGLFATVNIEDENLPFNKNEKLRSVITQLLKMIDLCANKQVPSNSEVDEIVELLQGAGSTRLGLDNEGITGQKYDNLFCKYLFEAATVDDARRPTLLQLLHLFAYAREIREINLRHYEEGDKFLLTAMAQRPISSGSSSAFRIKMDDNELTSFDRPNGRLITMYELSLLLLGEYSVPGFKTKYHSVPEEIERAVDTATNTTSFTLNITEADTESSGQQESNSSPTKAEKKKKQEKAGVTINSIFVMMKRVLDGNNDQDEIESDANEGDEEEQEEQEEQEDDAVQYSDSQIIARIKGLVSEGSKQVSRILPKGYNAKKSRYIEELEHEFLNVENYEYTSEDEEESANVGKPFDKSELVKHFKLKCNAKESNKTTPLNYMAKISTDKDNVNTTEFIGAWNEGEPDNIFPESGGKEQRRWNAWMRFANRAKQTWNMKELESKISTRKTLLLYPKNCHMSMHLEEKLETEDVREYGAEVYDEYREEQARKEDETNGGKKRGASIESEGEDDNTSKRHKSP